MKKGFKISLFLILISAVHIFNACEHEQGVAPQGLQPTFSSIQANIFTPRCVNRSCHPGGGAPMSLASGVAYNNLVNVPSAYGMPRVMPLNAENSALFLKVTGSSLTGNQMPLGFPALSRDEIDAIQDWIEAGAKND